MSDELLQAMWGAYTSVSDPRPFRAHDAMRAVLDVLHSNGYRRCAEGQAVTQYCSAWEQADKACRDLIEKVIPNIRERAEKAEAEVERLRADAERYLWLIDNIDPADAGLPQPVDYWDTRDPVWKRQIDAAIDAAIRARGES